MKTAKQPPKAVFFGAIGTLAETSDLQRRAFNAAFAQAGIDWLWDIATYRDLLKVSGGQARIEAFAAQSGQKVDAKALHRRKTALFQDMLGAVDLPLRPGVADVIASLSGSSIALGLVTTTSGGNIDRLLSAAHPPLGHADFSTVITGDQVARRKPAPDCYRLALRQLGLTAENVIAIEDSPNSAQSALAAGLQVLAFPGMFHDTNQFAGCYAKASALSMDILGLAPAKRVATA